MLSKREAVTEGIAFPPLCGWTQLTMNQVVEYWLTKAFLHALNGTIGSCVTTCRQARAFVWNPAPGIHSGTYFTED
jgi:hypothetical protein